MTVVSNLVGSVTPTSARVVGKVEGSPVRLAVATNPGMFDAVFFGPVTPSVEGVVSITASGLTPDTQYHFALEVDSVVDEDFPGAFRTLPPIGQPADFTFWAASCAGSAPEFPGVGDVLVPNRISNHPVFDSIRQHPDELLFGVHMGDLAYYDLGSGNHGLPAGEAGASLDNYRRMYDDVFTQPRQHALYRSMPHVYLWDDHDWGPNDSDRTAPGADNAPQVYRERWPHYPLPHEKGIFQSWQVGRVLFVGWDVRSARDPNEMEDDGTKTMLGEDQKAWMHGVLSASDAKFLVLVSSSQWHRTSGADTWNDFTRERSEIVAMLDETGWLGRMILVQGDGHALGMNSGATNTFGGFPVYQLAPLDSSPISSNPGLWDVGLIPHTRGLYGTVRIRDTGSQIEVTATGWEMDDAVLTHQLVVDVAPDPPPAVAPVAQARIRRRVTWLGVSAATGRIVAELPDITGQVRRLLSAHQSASVDLPIPLSGPGHIPMRLVEQATQPVRAAVVAVVNDLPTWMGWILVRRGGTDGTLRLGCITPEGYLARRRVRDHTFSAVDRALIAAGILADAGPIPGVGDGFGFDLDVELTGDPIDRTYLASDRQTVYDALRELCAGGGLEFTVELDWSDDARTEVRKILRVGPRIGRGADPVLFETTASSMFETTAGSEATYELTEDASTGRYANYLIAYAPGEGDDQPASAPAISQSELDSGAPIVERHWQPSSSITRVATLNRHATTERDRIGRVPNVWDIRARLDAYPRPGVDARIGDDVAWHLVGHRHPGGVMGRGRMVGWVLDHAAGTWSPILLQPGEDVV